MKTFHLASFIFSLAFVFSSCTKEKVEEEDTDNTSKCTPSYKSQTATGKFSNTAFTYVMGYAEEDHFDAGKYTYHLYAETVVGEMCDHANFDKPAKSIIFGIPKAAGEYKLGYGTGKYTVSFNYSVIDSTHVDAATCGAIKITSMTDSTISGSIDAQYDDENYFNGDFTAKICK